MWTPCSSRLASRRDATPPTWSRRLMGRRPSSIVRATPRQAKTISSASSRTRTGSASSTWAGACPGRSAHGRSRGCGRLVARREPAQRVRRVGLRRHRSRSRRTGVHGIRPARWRRPQRAAAVPLRERPGLSRWRRRGGARLSCEHRAHRARPSGIALGGHGRDAASRGVCAVSLTSLPPVAVQDAMPTTRGLNFYLEDKNLQFLCELVMDAATFERACPHLIAMGEVAGGELDELAAQADKNPPTLRAFDQGGRRVDEVVFHPSYKEMERIAFSRFGLAALSHRDGVLGWPGRVPQTVKYALLYLFAQSEFGLLCPVNMTDSVARMLEHYGSSELKAAWIPRLTTTDFDQLLQGTQWMTEKTGGSDVGAATTIARRDNDGTWRLWGDKWFCSNANTDVALTLARPEGAPAGTRGLGMFLVPKLLPDGSKNGWVINRLKDKFGSRSMASGEVTYQGAVAYVVGQVDAGFRQMMEMVNLSRLSNAMRAAGIMRRALLESLVHARGRAAFGGPLLALPLLRASVLE